ncbi:hypothetical protein OQA88_8750 [Cercophora sp. LCS_1]
MLFFKTQIGQPATAFAFLLLAVGFARGKSAPSDAVRTCREIEANISKASEVSFPGFLGGVGMTLFPEHWFKSSSQVPTCVVEVGSPEDVSVALQAIGRDRAPFAVMSGGHASNLGFSSTTGVLINMKRLDKVVLSENNKTVEIGFGQGWLDVFKKLDGTGYSVVGGRVPGPGVGGFTLGGGFSWKTNQFGLTCDTVIAYNLVLPNGTVTTVSQDSNPDLFFSLKGGMNRFGIVTSAVMKTHEQPPQVFVSSPSSRRVQILTRLKGGYIIYPPTSVPALLNATTAFFDTSTDRKTQIITTIGASPIGNTALALFFHDGPERPASLEPFERIPFLFKAVKQQSFLKFVSSIPSELAQAGNIRGAFATMSTSALTPRFLDAIKKECDKYGPIMALRSATMVSYDIEPFTPYGEFATDSAYPHSFSPLPLNLYFAWANKDQDQYWRDEMRASLGRLKIAAAEEGIYHDSFTQYPNYALASSTSEELYGALNAARLGEIRERIDPERVMGLTGGFKI